MTVALAGACFIMPASVGAQTPATPVVAGAANTAMLRAGTAVPLKMMEALTTKGKKLKPGYRFQMQTADAIMVNGMTVIPAGSPVTGEVTDVRNKGMWGKSGSINARVLFVRANGRQIEMTGQFDDKGTTGTAGVVGAIALMPIAGFLVTGTSATIPVGAPVNAFLNEDVPVAFAPTAPATAPAPMMVTPVAAVKVDAANK